MRLFLFLLFSGFSLGLFASTESDTTVSVEGKATYYHPRFHGRKCASGEVYDKNNLMAAHPSYPFGTYLRVTNLKNNKTVIVYVADRCPPRKNRLIDLSEKAAKELDFIRAGVAQVRLDVVDGPADMRYLERIEAAPIRFDADLCYADRVDEVLSQSIFPVDSSRTLTYEPTIRK